MHALFVPFLLNMTIMFAKKKMFYKHLFLAQLLNVLLLFNFIVYLLCKISEFIITKKVIEII